ncbi:glycosyltransferase family 87 protein [Burkholderia anthina]|uniref:glycosyltransferase family 87 protein n=1 Tax=Burkholderia anthina TaxID=179879 RepID=UPI0015887D1C|nr:glycosyltransferase family 87 protein [Burkholderia anthina]
MGTVRNTAVRATDQRRLGTYAGAALILQVAVLAILAIRYYVLHDRPCPMVGSDFAIFWAAARVAIEHDAVAVFSPQWMQPIEASLRPIDAFLPWPYPPTFLLVAIPFGLMPFVPALILFATLQIGCYAMVIARLVRSFDGQVRIAIAAFPGMICAAFTMQNSFITLAAAVGALLLLDSSPVLAGACVSILILKPQLGIMFPIAFVCGRHWKALISAGAFSACIIAVSAITFGMRMWVAFFDFLPRFNRVVVEDGVSFWRTMPSTFSLARLAGLPITAAYCLQAIVAILGVGAVAFVWARPSRYELRSAVLGAATLLVQSYFMYYNLLWLILPIAFLLLDSRHVKLQRYEIIVIGLAWLVPAQAFITALTGIGWSFAPIILVAIVAIIIRRSSAMSGFRLMSSRRP